MIGANGWRWARAWSAEASASAAPPSPRSASIAVCAASRWATASASSVSSFGQLLVLAGVGDRRRVEFVDLEPQQVDLSGAGLLVAAQRRQLGVDLGDPGAGGAQRCQVDRPERVQRGALGDPAEQALMGVLAVQVDHAVGELGQRRHGRRAPVDVRPRPPVGGDHA